MRAGILNLRKENFLFEPHPRVELFKTSPLYALPMAWNVLRDIKHQNNC
jgi:hypothetical protein